MKMRLKSPRAAALSLRASAECSCVAQGAEPLAAALAFSSATTGEVSVYTVHKLLSFLADLLAKLFPCVCPV